MKAYRFEVANVLSSILSKDGGAGKGKEQSENLSCLHFEV
jgi:hypothetical protein